MKKEMPCDPAYEDEYQEWRLTPRGYSGPEKHLRKGNGAVQNVIEKVRSIFTQTIEVLSSEEKRGTPEARASLYDNITAVNAEVAEVFGVVPPSGRQEDK